MSTGVAYHLCFLAQHALKQIKRKTIIAQNRREMQARIIQTIHQFQTGGCSGKAPGGRSPPTKPILYLIMLLSMVASV